MFIKLGWARIQIKMAIYKQPSLTGGMDQSLVEIITAVPSFTIGLLLFVYGVVFLGGTATQKRLGGYADYPLWSLLASVSVGMIAMLLSIKSGLIQGEVLGVVISLILISGFWFFLSKGRGEF